MDEIEYLAENPNSGKNYGHVIEGYFRTRIKSHFIFYKINHKKEEMGVIRILHQKMDIDSRLND